MRYHDEDDAKDLNAEQWQLDLLKLNPGYVSWGPHEDYMWKKGEGWDCPILLDSWTKIWQLDYLNECVNFYFSVERESKECPTCGGNGYHKDAQQVVNTFYSHMNSLGEHWNDKITDDELQALKEASRVNKDATLEQINAENRPRGGMGHDAINRGILTRARLGRLGLPVLCEQCAGSGYVYTAPNAEAVLTLWMLHPRKGCSRGIEVRPIKQDELPSIYEWLRSAAARNAERFSAVPTPTDDRTAP